MDLLTSLPQWTQVQANWLPRFVICIAALSCGGFGFAQQTIHIPADQPTIQAGIDAANNGDTVFVSPGTYNENIDFKGRVITVTSGAKAFADSAVAATIISGIADGYVVTFHTNEPTAAILNGFTIQKGHASPTSKKFSGGISISAASPTITNNIVTDNAGCGILAANRSSSLIQGNDIVGNHGPPANSSNYVNESRCIRYVSGVGIWVDSVGYLQVVGNIIEKTFITAPPNDTTGGGIGIVVDDGGEKVLFQNNMIRNNLSSSGVAGLSTGSLPANLSLIQNLFYGNVSLAGLQDAQQINLIGSYSFNPPYPQIIQINNTVYGAGENLVQKFGPSLFANNIFFNSHDSPSSAPVTFAGLLCAGPPDGQTTIQFDHNDVYNNGSPKPSGCNFDAGRIAVDPRLLDAANGNLHTEPTSPVVAAGDINAPQILTADLDNKARTVCGTIDMGVYEVRPRPATVVTSSNNPSVGGTPVTLTARVPGNCNVPTGTVTFLDGSNPIGTVPLYAGAIGNIATASLTVGSHNITVNYPGDFNFDASTSAILVQVVTGYPTSTSLQVVPHQAGAFQAISFSATVSSHFGTPTGTITFFAGTTAVDTAALASNGTAATTVNALGAGTYDITAVYNADVNFASSRSSPMTLVVIAARSATTLGASPNPVYQGQSVTFQAGVTGAQIASLIATGTVQIFDGTTSLGGAALSAGNATFSTNSLVIGSHPITAVYSGNSNFGPSTSPIVTEVVLASSYKIGISPARITLSAGQPTQTILIGTSVGAYIGTLNLSSGEIPEHATLSFSPTTLSLTGGGTASSNVSIITGDLPSGVNKAQNQGPADGFRLRVALAAILALPILVLRRGRLPMLLAVIAAVSLLAFATGCTNVYLPFNSVGQGTYVISIIATDSATQTTQTAKLTLVVTP